MSEFLFQGGKDQTVDKFPDIGHESNRFELPFLVIIAQVISLDLNVENENSMRKDIFSESSGIVRKRTLVDPEDHETYMP